MCVRHVVYLSLFCSDEHCWSRRSTWRAGYWVDAVGWTVGIDRRWTIDPPFLPSFFIHHCSLWNIHGNFPFPAYSFICGWLLWAWASSPIFSFPRGFHSPSFTERLKAWTACWFHLLIPHSSMYSSENSVFLSLIKACVPSALPSWGVSFRYDHRQITIASMMPNNVPSTTSRSYKNYRTAKSTLLSNSDSGFPPTSTTSSHVWNR